MTKFADRWAATGDTSINSFEERGFAASAIASIQPVRSEFESRVYSEVMLHYLGENAARADEGRNDFVKFETSADMFTDYWKAVLG